MRKIFSLFVFSAFLVLPILMAINVGAVQSDGMVLEWEQHWETYGIGGTCITSNKLSIVDIDGDGFMEIITGGSLYYLFNDTRTASEPTLKIFNWNGQNITFEKSYKLETSIRSIYSGDADGDGSIEIIIAGTVSNSTGSYPQIGVYQWNGEDLVLKGSYEGISVSSIFVDDVNKDGKPEIFSVGRAGNSTQFYAMLNVWSWDGNSLTLDKSVEWDAVNANSANSIYSYDLGSSGVNEIITGGYANTLKNSSGQLRIWEWNGEDFSLKANEEWRLKDDIYGPNIAGGVQGNTVVNNVKVGDVDDDGVPEIITGGFTYDGEKTVAQLRIWNWNGQSLTLERSQEWDTQDIVEVKTISLNDVDSDGRKEIITSGVSAAYGSFYSNDPEIAQLRVWSWDGTTLTLKQSQDWYIDEGATAWNIASGDVDKDGDTEIVTVGCSSIGSMCDPDMRIWSIAKSDSFDLMAILVIIGAAIVVVLPTTFFYYRRRSGT